MDENADRAQVPGQQPVPERDIEPLWPPDPADRGAGGAAPPWAAVAEQRGAPSPVAPPPVTPPVAAPPVGRPPVPGQPGAAALPPPSPSDYPSLTGAVPAPGGWGVSGPSGAGTGWAPPQPSWPPANPAAAPTPPATGTPPAPPAPPAAGAPPATGAPAISGFPGSTGIPASAASAGTPASAGSPASAASTPTDGSPEAASTAVRAAQASDRGPTAVPASPSAPGGVDLDLPFTLDRPTAAAAPTERPTAATSPTQRPATAAAPTERPATAAPTERPATASPTPADSATAGPAATGPAGQGGGTGEAGSVGGAARPATESPWAYPPQRPAGAPAPARDEAAPATPPIPAPPRPQPPHSGVPQAGPGQTHSGPTHPGQTYSAQSFTPAIPGQTGPPQIPPPPDLTQFSNSPHGGPAPQQAGPATPPPGPFPPSPGWYPPPWQQGTPGVPPGQPYQEADGVTRVPTTGYPDTPGYPEATGYPDATWTPEATAAPTAEDFARRRQVRPADPVATMGVRAVVNKMGLLRLAPGRQEQELKRDIEMVRRNFGGLRQVTVVNPKGGAGKTVAILLLAMTFGQKRGGYVLAWDNNETQGTLGMRAQQDFHSRTVRDMLRDLGQFQGSHGRVGDLSQYVRSQGEGMFDVLASDESATGGEMLTAAAFAEIREVVSRFYKLIFVDTGNNVRAQNWQASMDATDQLVVTMSARNDSAETAARMLDHLEQSGRQRLVRQAVTVVSMPPSRKEIDLPAIQEHFAARTRAVLLAPYERLIDTGEPIRYGGLSAATRDAWLKIAAAVAEGL
ncbi:chromosome partitioning protein [Micromonospora sp. NPDC005413]|uniref:chromosome partitioning protein n=1 Tax=Micromonospora sp. NPDC005413 TaxID=3154563 RepID=UPI0033BC8B6A